MPIIMLTARAQEADVARGLRRRRRRLHPQAVQPAGAARPRAGRRSGAGSGRIDRPRSSRSRSPSLRRLPRACSSAGACCSRARGGAAPRTRTARLRPIGARDASRRRRASAAASLTGDEAASWPSCSPRYARQRRAATPRERIAAYFETRGDVGRSASCGGSPRADLAARAAAYSLGDMGSRRAVPRCSTRARRPASRDVRAAAGARASGGSRAVEAVAPLVDALADRRGPARGRRPALLEIGPAGAAGLRALLVTRIRRARRRDRARRAASATPADAAALLERAAATPPPRSAPRRPRALGRLGAEDAAAALRDALDDRVRVRARRRRRGARAARRPGRRPTLLDQARERRLRGGAGRGATRSREIDPDALLERGRGAPDAGRTCTRPPTWRCCA